MKTRPAVFSAFLLTALLAGCTNDTYQALSLIPQGDHFVANGVIDGSAPKTVREALAEYPDIKTIVFDYVPGSANDEANLEAARLIRAAGVKTVVPSGALVASGGTDLFLAGAEREVGPGACLGVHSWADGDTAQAVQGRDVPRDDPQHQLYLSYYSEMGIDGAFYWYTLDAADAQGMHYMTNDEIAQYGIATVARAGSTEATAEACERVADGHERSSG